MKWVLVRGDGRYSLGDFTGTEFKEETEQFDSDSGPNFYATQTWENAPHRRRVQVAWMRGGTYPDMPFNQQVTFPRELTLRTTSKGPRMFRQPIREIESLYAGEETWTNRTLNAGQSLPLAPSGDCFRLQADVSLESNASLTLNVRGTKVTLTRDNMTCGNRTVRLASTLTNIDVLLDRTSIEMFANGGEESMSKCYLGTESGLSMRASSGRATIERLKLIRLSSAWK
jgi:levanase/fructan beta-fructosidase